MVILNSRVKYVVTIVPIISAAPRRDVAGKPHILNWSGFPLCCLRKNRCVTNIIDQVNIAPNIDTDIISVNDASG